jgi:CRISPR-associated protein Cmr2
MSQEAGLQEPSQLFWQAKIWAMLHAPALKVLEGTQANQNSPDWLNWAAMAGWPSATDDAKVYNSAAFQQVQQAHLIAAASDRGALSNLPSNPASIADTVAALNISHLFSGAQQPFAELSVQRRALILAHIQRSLAEVRLNDSADGTAKPLGEITDRRKLAWWLWRCLPIEAGRALDPAAPADKKGNQLLLLPAEARLPDASVWSYTSITAALASGLTGYDLALETLPGLKSPSSLPKVCLATFSFTPVQELIKASRKMRDFWAGSWVLHYLSAKICWKIAQKYGPDSLLYPSLFQQPLIDYWLRQQWPDFDPWVEAPTHRQLLTAGFPNVLVFVLPESKVQGAMQMAKQILKAEWRDLGDKVLKQLHDRYWMRTLQSDHKTWQGWLDAQWQTYWSAVPLGDRQQPLLSDEDHNNGSNRSAWCQAQNQVCQLGEDESTAMFSPAESQFLRKATELQNGHAAAATVNVGSWWPHTFAQARRSLMAVKSARPWTLPTAFSNRSTISGWGPAVHPDQQPDREHPHPPGPDWIAEGTLQTLWRDPAGLFDGREQLNATEVLKRGLQKILPDLFPDLNAEIDQVTDELKAYYPDLTAGVAGYLKTHGVEHRAYYRQFCQDLNTALASQNGTLVLQNNWGIPWIDESADPLLREFHPRHLNAGWLAEEVSTPEIQKLEKSIRRDTSDANINRYGVELLEKRKQLLEQRKQWRDHEFKPIIERYYQEGNNPADWYVLAAGDGDGMSNWLKGKHLESYQTYMPDDVTDRLREISEFQAFLQLPKRMGPATHSALSRALLDFSNQLLPYLTEERYAGRLIYGGGDDVLAYSNLWEWDQWLWDVRQCFRGAKDPHSGFISDGDYWRWNPAAGELPKNVSARPLFTMGRKATISFGMVIANQAVPLAIALENLWEAEEEAKDHFCQRLQPTDPQQSKPSNKKDAVQVRVLYGNGNILKATAKFDVFDCWRQLVNVWPDVEPALFEQAAELLNQHPIPVDFAIGPWSQAFCDRRDVFAGNDELKQRFCTTLTEFLAALWRATEAADRDREMQTWLKLAAFMLRKRTIKLRQLGGEQ